MAIHFESATHSPSDIERIESIYDEAFPREGKEPIHYLVKRSRQPHISLLSIYDDETWVGFLYTVTHKDLLLVFYFAIDSRFRGCGYGSSTLAALKEQNPEKRIFLDVESVDDKAENNEQRIKRKAFYLRNGFLETEYRFLEPHCNYDILTTDLTVTAEEIKATMKTMTGFFAGLFARPKVYDRKGNLL